MRRLPGFLRAPGHVLAMAPTPSGGAPLFVTSRRDRPATCRARSDLAARRLTARRDRPVGSRRARALSLRRAVGVVGESEQACEVDDVGERRVATRALLSRSSVERLAHRSHVPRGKHVCGLGGEDVAELPALLRGETRLPGAHAAASLAVTWR